MNPWTVNMVTAFGRGESLALALHDKGFNVNVYDLTDAFPFEYRRGAGPFPIPRQAYLGPHEGFFQKSDLLPKGMTVWLKDGPLEFAGPMASFFVENHEAFRAAVQNDVRSEFATDWLRRLLRNLVAPFYHESWQLDSRAPFPVDKPLVMVSRLREQTVFGFDRLQGKVQPRPSVKINDVQIESGRLVEMEIDTGHAEAVTAPQWVWCLSSQETEILNPQVAETLFSRDVRRPEWLWISMKGAAERGPWNDGFPRYSVVIDDVFLPWTHANLFALEWLDQDQFEVWLRVPAEAARDAAKRGVWAKEIEEQLSGRLSLGHWRLDPLAFSICPHSPIFPEMMKEWKEPGWKNWDWIAPETIARLDFGARFEREVQSFQRLMNWRNDQIKKQGAQGDQAVHAP